MSYLRKMGYLLGKRQAAHPWAFIVFAIIVTLATIPGIPVLLQHVEPSLEKVLPQDIKEVAVMNDLRSQFGADMLYLVVNVEDASQSILDPQYLSYVDSLTQALSSVDHVIEVRSVTPELKGFNNGILPTTRAAAASLLRQHQTSMRYLDDSQTFTMIAIKSDTGASAAKVKEVIDAIDDTEALLAAQNPGVSLTLTGFNAIDQATFAVIISDFTHITLISFALMVVFLLLHYRFSIKKTVYSMVIMVFALVWSLGITGYLGIELNVVTMVSAAMIMALGSSYGINSVYHFYDDFLLQYEKEEAIAKFQEFLIIGLTGSAFAEIAGFLALLFGLMPSMRSLGVILAIGIFCALVVSVVVLPVLFYLMEKGGEK